MTRKTSSPSGLSLGGLSGGSSGGSSGCPAASGGNKGHNHLTVVHGGSGPAAGGGPGNARGQPTSYSTASTASDHSDPLSWAPLLGNRSGPESSLWWKITHFHAPILLKISSTEKSIELCSTKSWLLFFEIWKSEQRKIFVKLKQCKKSASLLRVISLYIIHKTSRPWCITVYVVMMFIFIYKFLQ